MAVLNKYQGNNYNSHLKKKTTTKQNPIIVGYKLKPAYKTCFTARNVGNCSFSGGDEASMEQCTLLPG